MSELIIAILDFINELRFGSLINRHLNYRKMLSHAAKVPCAEDVFFRNFVSREIASLKSQLYAPGAPCIALFRSSINGYFRVYILNDDLQYMCRLQNFVYEGRHDLYCIL